MRIAFLLALSISLLPVIGFPQTPVERYRFAEKMLERHKQEYDFLHDDSPEAVAALKSMWAASADAVVQFLTNRPAATPADISQALCQLEPAPAGCEMPTPDRSNVAQLGPQLFVVSEFSSEVGTVFVVGLRDGKPELLWSIGSAAAQSNDRRGLIGAWRAERAGGACRDKGTKYKPGACGGLYADLGLLTPDGDGRPRFYVNAGYAQLMGATVAHQTSVWRWDGDSATLLWIDLYDFMIDQNRSVEFHDGILSMEEKDEFRSFYSCGSCEARQMLRRLRITPNGVEDLGKVTTTPELDLIDEVFWRLAYGKPTEDIASPQVAELLKPQMAAAKRKSRKIAHDWFSTGMLGDVAYTHDGNVERVCFTADDIGRLYFTVQQFAGKPVILTHVEQPAGTFDDCPKSETGSAK